VSERNGSVIGSMRHARRRGGRLSLVGLILGIAALCVPVAPVVGQGRGPGGPDADEASIRISGPLVAKEMMEGLAAEFRKAEPPAGVEYLRMEAPPAAVRALVAGQDMVVTLGKVTEQDLGDSRARWKALKPQEHIIGARVAAVVVHARNPVDSLTRKQLWAIFSEDAKSWDIFGGAKKPIRRYGLPPYGPLGKMFHDTIIPANRCRMMFRRSDSEAVLKAVASDPEAIAFVDAVPAMSAGDSVKIVAIGDADASSAAPAARPNAQTIKDGTYPLAETVVLYVSGEASLAAQDFAEFIVSGEGGGVYRKNGFLPTLGVVRADVLAAFEKLYGPDIKQVKATAGPADDLALARKLIRSARTMHVVPELLAAMCEAAYDLTASTSGGETLAFEGFRGVPGTQYLSLFPLGLAQLLGSRTCSPGNELPAEKPADLPEERLLAQRAGRPLAPTQRLCAWHGPAVPNAGVQQNRWVFSSILRRLAPGANGGSCTAGQRMWRGRRARSAGLRPGVRSAGAVRGRRGALGLPWMGLTAPWQRLGRWQPIRPGSPVALLRTSQRASWVCLPTGRFGRAKDRLRPPGSVLGGAGPARAGRGGV